MMKLRVIRIITRIEESMTGRGEMTRRVMVYTIVETLPHSFSSSFHITQNEDFTFILCSSCIPNFGVACDKEQRSLSTIRNQGGECCQFFSRWWNGLFH